jgi:hypothetical protein
VAGEGSVSRNTVNGLGAGDVADHLVVYGAVLFPLCRATRARPLLLIADDLQWVDRAGAAALAFIARRLTGSRLGPLAASRPGFECFFERAGLPACTVSPLDDRLTPSATPNTGRSATSESTTATDNRPREWGTRAVTVELSIPKRRSGNYFPHWLPERRRRAEQALGDNTFGDTGTESIRVLKRRLFRRRRPGLAPWRSPCRGAVTGPPRSSAT